MSSELKITVLYSDDYGEKVIGNLINFYGFCRACETFEERLYCDNCRYLYGSFAEHISSIFRVERPSAPFIEKPESLLPRISPCDILIAVALHPDLALALPRILADSGVKAILFPIEDPAWMSPGLSRQIREECLDIGLECAFPKPFCSLSFGCGSTIDGFLNFFKAGKPLLNVEVSKGTVRRVRVLRSSPCGSTWYVARKIVGCMIDDLPDVISKAHHAYPCTASMTRDSELGDTILHRAGYIIFEAVYKGVKDRHASMRLLRVFRERKSPIGQDL